MPLSSMMICPSMLLLTGCSLDINDDTNHPNSSSVTTDLVFPSAENFIADCVGDQLFNYAGFFVQYFEQMPTENQYNDIADELAKEAVGNK